MSRHSNLSIDFLQAHQTFVRRLARSLVRDSDLADDVVQQTWLAAPEGMPTRPRSPRAWLAAVLRNIVPRTLRRDGLRTRGERIFAERRESPSAAEEVARRLAQQRRVLQAVLELEEPYRSTVDTEAGVVDEELPTRPVLLAEGDIELGAVLAVEIAEAANQSASSESTIGFLRTTNRLRRNGHSPSSESPLGLRSESPIAFVGTTDRLGSEYATEPVTVEITAIPTVRLYGSVLRGDRPMESCGASVSDSETGKDGPGCTIYEGFFSFAVRQDRAYDLTILYGDERSPRRAVFRSLSPLESPHELIVVD